MEKYVFNKFNTTEYQTDPVFKLTNFTLYGNPAAVTDEPELFEIEICSKRFRYCLVKPGEIKNNNELLLKTRRYILAHEDKRNLNNPINTYFIGDTQKSIDVSTGFTGQNKLLLSYEIIEQWYPKKLYDVFKIIISHVLREQKYLGQFSFFRSLSDDVIFVDPKLNDNEKNQYRDYLQRCMVQEGLITLINTGVRIDCFVLTNKAIDLVQNNSADNNKVAFVAIKFDGNKKRISTILSAITEAGYEPKIMSEVETNNWIMPEIFDWIENSRFVVADFSLPCDGAYYEAGYAAALKKPVIHLFDKREEKKGTKLHFDIAQKSTIFYKDYKDLKTRLINRIKATIK